MFENDIHQPAFAPSDLSFQNVGYVHTVQPAIEVEIILAIRLGQSIAVSVQLYRSELFSKAHGGSRDLDVNISAIYEAYLLQTIADRSIGRHLECLGKSR
jgi:hypothetical protein